MKRRPFLKTAAAGAAGLTLVKPGTAFGSKANSKITLGVIGCGGRGRFVCKRFVQTVEEDVHILAAHDYFEDQLQPMRAMFDVEKSNFHTGLYGYRDLLSTSVDAVVITSPPYFHPEQASDTVEAGKHVWLAKPVCVDVPGGLSVKAAGKKAEGRLAFLVDFQSRNSPYFIEAVKRVHNGDIGGLVSGEAFNHFPCIHTPRDTAGLTEDQARLRNYPTDKVLSGDDVLDQAVHAVDIIDWIVGSHPTQAYGTGGLKVRVKNGDNWDHNTVIYWYGDGPVIDLNCSRFVSGCENLGGRIFGSKGVVYAHYCAPTWGAGPVSIVGEKPWPGIEHDDTWFSGVDNNCRDFVKAIRSGEYMNHAEYGAESAFTGILGREASYKSGMLTREELFRESRKLEANLKL